MHFLKIIFSCMNNMFSANTKMGKSCHLCLEHDYTTAFSECQGLSEKNFKCAFHKAFYSNPPQFPTKAVLKWFTSHHGFSRPPSPKCLILVRFLIFSLHERSCLSRRFLANFQAIEIGLFYSRKACSILYALTRLLSASRWAYVSAVIVMVLCPSQP